MLNAPAAPGCVAVTFADTASAVGGIPHWFVRMKFRTAKGITAGPPYGPAGLRVSTTRQGGSVKKLIAQVATTLVKALLELEQPLESVRVTDNVVYAM